MMPGYGRLLLGLVLAPVVAWAQPVDGTFLRQSLDAALLEAAEQGDVVTASRRLEQGADIHVEKEGANITQLFFRVVRSDEQDKEWRAMVARESSLAYLRRVLDEGLTARCVEYNEGMLEGDLESCKSYSKAKLLADRQVMEIVEACRKWQLAEKSFLDAYWQKKLAARDLRYRDTRGQVVEEMAEGVRGDARALAQSACWYQGKVLEKLGLRGFHFYFFEPPAGAPPFVQQLMQRLETHGSKHEAGDAHREAVTYWRAELAQQVAAIQALLLRDELADLFAKAHLAWENYMGKMMELAREYCRCTSGMEVAMMEMHAIAHYERLLKWIMEMDCRKW